MLKNFNLLFLQNQKLKEIQVKVPKLTAKFLTEQFCTSYKIYEANRRRLKSELQKGALGFIKR